MHSLIVYGLLLIFVAFFSETAFSQNELLVSKEGDTMPNQSSTYRKQLGTVHFPVSCNTVASQHAQRGLALLHHMTYEGARAEFISATEADPDCAMGYWGQAMSFIHPLWSDHISEADFKSGQTLVNEARRRGERTEWEHAYIAAVAAYYTPGWHPDDKANLAAFEKAWQRVYEQFPEDPEAACFYALAHLATARPEDQRYIKQKRAVKIAKKVLSRIPDHPGAHHYIIHAYDYPSLAEQALEVARNYAEIAPEVSHALHMPTHIFTQLGLWQESIEMNQRSAATALEHPVKERISLYYPHALNYLVYAYLQRAEDEKVEEILSTIRSHKKPFEIHLATAYAFAVIPARFTLERQQWVAASLLEPGMPRDYPWHQFPAMEAITHFARALGAARSGNERLVPMALDRLIALREQIPETSKDLITQIDIHRLTAQAWLMYQQGRQQQALKKMHKAVEMEATEKHPISPGRVLPIRELLADMLLESGLYQSAQKQYLAVLARNPNRFNSLYGVARAAELAGNKKIAVQYYKQLLKIVAPQADRTRLQQARAFLVKTSTPSN